MFRSVLKEYIVVATYATTLISSQNNNNNNIYANMHGVICCHVRSLTTCNLTPFSKELLTGHIHIYMHSITGNLVGWQSLRNDYYEVAGLEQLRFLWRYDVSGKLISLLIILRSLASRFSWTPSAVSQIAKTDEITNMFVFNLFSGSENSFGEKIRLCITCHLETCYQILHLYSTNCSSCRPK